MTDEIGSDLLQTRAGRIQPKLSQATQKGWAMFPTLKTSKPWDEKRVPSRDLTYLYTLEKGKSSTQHWLFRGYVSSQGGIFYLKLQIFLSPKSDIFRKLSAVDCSFGSGPNLQPGTCMKWLIFMGSISRYLEPQSQPFIKWMDVWWFSSHFLYKDLVHHPIETIQEMVVSPNIHL